MPYPAALHVILGIAIGLACAIPTVLLASSCSVHRSPALDRVLAYLIVNARDRGTWIGALRLAGMAGIAVDPGRWPLYAGLGAGLGELARVAMMPPGVAP